MSLWDDIAALFDAYDEEEEERKRREEEEELERLLEEERQRQKEEERERRKEALEEERERQEKLEELAHKEEEEKERLKQEAIEKAEEKLREKKKQEEEKNNSFELAKEAGKGFLEGGEGALFDLANGATFGGASKIDQKYFGGTMSKMNNELENLADAAGLGNIYRGVQGFNEGVGAGLGVFGAKNIGGYGLNEAIKWNGRRELINQLERGDNFKDINFGKMNKDTLEDINKLRELGGYDSLTPQTYIPANVVKKLYEKRLSEGYTPQAVAEIARDLFQKGKQYVTESHQPHIQQVIQPKNSTSDVGYVAQNTNNGQTVIKSVYRKPNQEIKELDIKGILDGRTHSSSAPRYQNVNNNIQITRPAAARFSALQDTIGDNITSPTGDVNSTIEDLIEELRKEDSFLEVQNTLPQNGFGKPNVWGQNTMLQNAFGVTNSSWQNPYSQIMPVKSQEEEDLEELLKRLRRMRRGS